jgi:PAS domain S-box-containing protein
LKKSPINNPELKPCKDKKSMKNTGKSRKHLLAEIKNLKQQIKRMCGSSAAALNKSSIIDSRIIQGQKQYILDNIYDMVWLKDKDSRYVMVNEAFENICGIKANGLIGKTDFDIWPKNLARKYRADDKKIMLTKKRSFIEEELVNSHGKLFIVETIKSPFYDDKGAVIGTVGIAHNITKRKNAERELLKLNTLLDSIIENIPNMIFLKDAKELKFLKFNRAGEELLGYGRNELLGKNDYDFFTKKQADFFIQKDREVLADRKILDIKEEPIQTRRRGTRILHTKKVPLLNSKGEPAYLLGISEDITEYKKAYVQISELKAAQQSLKESEVRYKVLFESANDAIFLTDAQTGIIVDANKKASALIGRPVNRIIGMHYLDLHPKEAREFYKGVFDTHSSKNRPFTQVAFVVRKSRHIPVQVSASNVSIKGNKLMIEVFSDITALKKIEDRLKNDKSNLQGIITKERKKAEALLSDLEDAKRLADIGSLASTIAHELRNPLGVIKTAAYNIKQKSGAVYLKKIRSHLSNIDKKICESDRIISNLLGYSKLSVIFYERFYIYKIINECISNFRQKYNMRNLKLIVDCSPVRDLRMRADRGQIISLLSNVLDNAYQALPDGAGTIRLSCRRYKQGKHVLIAVKDSGIGLSKADISKAFEPFFSLKIKGIGLGLSVCRQIVKLHKGSLKIMSKRSKGTTVKISLPVSGK